MVVATNGSSTLEQFNGPTIPLSNLSYNSFVNVDRGDPVGFTTFWENLREEAKVEIKGDEVMSYFGDANLCWYMLPQMRNAILRLHKVVGNANTEDKYIVLGNGSSHVYLALLYALSTEKPSHIPINVVAAAPHYSSSKSITKQRTYICSNMVVDANGCSPLKQSNGTTIPLSNFSYNSFVNVDRGDPVGFTTFWENLREEAKVEIKGDEVMSYFGDANLCWYMLPQMRNAILRLHKVVGNANTEDKYIVLGNGSSHVYLALLYALSTEKSSDIPINVVAAAPHYSEYEGATDILQSKLFQWSGDASVYDKDEPYIEVVTSPNNPDGTLRTPVVKSDAEGKVIYDLAYYWPQYTPINHELNQDIMLFTFSKCTGHAGSRIGWALVKDIEIAKKMVKFLHLTSIGVSKESQVRAAKIIEVICDGYQNSKSTLSDHLFFDYSKKLMKDRWEKLKVAVEQSKVFTLPKYSTAYCHFTKEITDQYPAFAWLKSVEGIEDGESYLKKLKILTGGGKRFGVDPAYVRISMIGTDDEFIELCTRLANAKIE